MGDFFLLKAEKAGFRRFFFQELVVLEFKNDGREGLRSLCNKFPNKGTGIS